MLVKDINSTGLGMLSLVTINFKNYNGLEKTLKSIAEQKIDEVIELIIVDGGSCEASYNLIKSFSCSHVKMRWVSEKDGGIYDAMNKGLSLSSGEFVAFLNSGDCFYSDNILGTLLNAFSACPNLDFLYSDLSFVNNKGEITRTWISGKFFRYKLFLGWMAPHPMTIIRRSELISLGGFDQKFSIASDYDLMLRILMGRNINVKYINLMSVKMEVGGVSNNSYSNVLRSNIEVLMSWGKMYGIFIPYWIFLTKPLSKFVQLKRFKINK